MTFCQVPSASLAPILCVSVLVTKTHCLSQPECVHTERHWVVFPWLRHKILGLPVPQWERRGNPTWLASSHLSPGSSRKHVWSGQVKNAIDLLRWCTIWSPTDNQCLFTRSSEAARGWSLLSCCRNRSPFNSWLRSNCGLLATGSWICWLISDICAPCPACGHFSAVSLIRKAQISCQSSSSSLLIAWDTLAWKATFQNSLPRLCFKPGLWPVCLKTEGHEPTTLVISTYFAEGGPWDWCGFAHVHPISCLQGCHAARLL